MITIIFLIERLLYLLFCLVFDTNTAIAAFIKLKKSFRVFPGLSSNASSQFRKFYQCMALSLQQEPEDATSVSLD